MARPGLRARGQPRSTPDAGARSADCAVGSAPAPARQTSAVRMKHPGRRTGRRPASFFPTGHRGAHHGPPGETGIEMSPFRCGGSRGRATTAHPGGAGGKKQRQGQDTRAGACSMNRWVVPRAISCRSLLRWEGSRVDCGDDATLRERAALNRLVLRIGHISERHEGEAAVRAGEASSSRATRAGA